MKLRRVSKSLLFTSIFLVELAVILNSVELLELSVLPLLLLVFPNLPFKAELGAVRFEGGDRVGETLEVNIELRIAGFGLIKAMHFLPDTFELVEGSNAGGRFIAGRGVIRLSYKCVPLKRGVYNLGILFVEAENIFATRRVRAKIEFEAEKEVKSRVYRVRRVEQRRGIARKPVPEIDVSKVGVPGTDFREIRKYSYGDPVKFINWKATAKIGELMVNEFEREGKKTVWIFLDANPYMLHGDLRKNCFETAVEVAASLAYYFAVRGHKVGFYTVGHELLIYPESGRRQFSKIYSTLVKLDVSDKEESLLSSVEKTRKYIEAVKPASIFVTRVELSNPLKAVMKAMGRKNLPVSVIAIAFKGDDSIGGSVEDAVRENTIRKLRAAGVAVTEVEAGKAVEVLAGVVK
ncbi:MAG: DUF58 domain-containing protein [Archaeoglobus sp.]|uniref:DUF58 domain-containing protein n=1 Tax=Archaeoglobus sp. TaxID=1872626 RepID=UPI001D9D05D0|nr:DUF58 domain-containing protein [Archaeoglobus sp.]MBO8180035.1 DUF58 domain-containing protein [Archaeoglobus sp.]